MRTERLQISNFIDGRFVEPISGRYLDNIEPATDKPYSEVADSLHALRYQVRVRIGLANAATPPVVASNQPMKPTGLVPEVRP